MSELKLCPFCGGRETIKTRYIGYGSLGLGSHDEYRVVCQECRASSDEYRSEAEAIAAWNRRAEPENEPDSEFGPVSEAEIERLRNKKTGYICTVCCFPMEESLEFCPACKAQGTIKEVI